MWYALIDPCWDVRTLRVDVGFLVEAFRDGDAGAEHVDSEHFKAAQRDLPQALAHTPQVISQTVDATGWSELAEITVD